MAARPSFYSRLRARAGVSDPLRPRQARDSVATMDLERSCVCMRCRPPKRRKFSNSKPAVTVESTVEPLHISICSRICRSRYFFLEPFAAHS